jgi:hypothetical protein
MALEWQAGARRSGFKKKFNGEKNAAASDRGNRLDRGRIIGDDGVPGD